MKCMKTTLTIFLLALIGSCATSQQTNKNFATFYSQYQDDEGVKSFEIPCFLAKKLFNDNDNNSDHLIKKITKLRFFISENDNGKYGNRIKYYLPNSDYHDLMVVKSNGNAVVFKIKELKNGDIKEVVMTITEPDSFVAVCFTGSFTMNDVKKMTNSIHSDNCANFDFNF